MRPFIRTIETLELDGGSLCLDFVNNVRNRLEHPLYEFITNPSAWLRWVHRVSLVDSSEEERLKIYISQHPVKAQQELKRIIKVRELLYRIFRSLANKEIPTTQDIKVFNKELSQSFRNISIDITEDLNIKENWNDESYNLLFTLHPLMKSAYELLISETLNRLKECDHCGWIYLDRSKNNSRRWCNMKTCGNTEKTKKYYYKSRTNVIDNPNE